MKNRVEVSKTKGIDYASPSFELYLNSIIHSWLKTLTALALTLVPVFLVLDFIVSPHEIFWKFVVYRVISTVVILGQFFVIRSSHPGKYSYIHGYLLSFVVTSVITIMTVDLGGFDSGYYAGLNLVVIAVNLLLPWRAIHSAFTSGIAIAGYVVMNLVTNQAFTFPHLVNNLFFLVGTAIIAFSINFVKHRLIRQEYELRSQILDSNQKLEQTQLELKNTRDALWGEMELAKQIQTALQPNGHDFGNYRIAAAMLPASEVGGDYFDVKAMPDGTVWFNIGDVSGHGVTSGLIMMMAQTAIATSIQSNPTIEPIGVVRNTNFVLSENMRRLSEFKYMTLTVLRADPTGTVTFCGKHQDLLIYRSVDKSVETIETQGTWLGVLPDLEGPPESVQESFTLMPNDIMLLYTDGITESVGQDGELFGDERLRSILQANGGLGAEELKEIILDEVQSFMRSQEDDITMLIVKRAN